MCPAVVLYNFGTCVPLGQTARAEAEAYAGGPASYAVVQAVRSEFDRLIPIEETLSLWEQSQRQIEAAREGGLSRCCHLALAVSPKQHHPCCAPRFMPRPSPLPPPPTILQVLRVRPEALGMQGRVGAARVQEVPQVTIMLTMPMTTRCCRLCGPLRPRQPAPTWATSACSGSWRPCTSCQSPWCVLHMHPYPTDGAVDTFVSLGVVPVCSTPPPLPRTRLHPPVVTSV